MVEGGGAWAGVEFITMSLYISNLNGVDSSMDTVSLEQHYSNTRIQNPGSKSGQSIKCDVVPFVVTHNPAFGHAAPDSQGFVSLTAYWMHLYCKWFLFFL